MKKLFLSAILLASLLTSVTAQVNFVGLFADTNGVLKSPTNLFAANIANLTNTLKSVGFGTGGGNVNSNSPVVFSQVGSTNPAVTNQFAGFLATTYVLATNAVYAEPSLGESGIWFGAHNFTGEDTFYSDPTYGIVLFGAAGHGGVIANAGSAVETRWFDNGGWLFNGPVTNASTLSVGGIISGNGFGITNVMPPEVQAMNPTAWWDMTQLSASNGQTILTIPDFSGNGWSLTNASATPAPWHDANHGWGARPTLAMEANWNPVTGAAPTVWYAYTNSLMFGNTNWSATFTYLLKLNNGGAGMTPLLNSSGVIQYLFQDGFPGSDDLASPFYTQSGLNERALTYNQVSSSAQICPTPAQFVPTVVTFRMQNGFLDEFVNGVQDGWTNTSSHIVGTVANPFFLLGNEAASGITISPQLGSLCADMSEVLITASNAPSTAAVLNYQAYVMKKYGMGGGPSINFIGDSITYGTIGLYPTNFDGITRAAFPGVNVSNQGQPGQTSTTILATQQASSGMKPYGSGMQIDVIMDGVNNNLQAGTLLQWEEDFTNLVALKHAQGHLVDWCTLPSFNGESNVPTRASMNGYVYANSNLLDAIVAYDQDPLMGTNGSCVVQSNLFFSGLSPLFVHPMPAGYMELCTNELFPILQAQLYGGRSSAFGISPSFTGVHQGNGNNLSLGITTTNGVSISLIQSLAVGQTIRVICPTNIIGWTNGTSTVVTNSCASFYLSGSPASPGVYEVRGLIGGQCTNSTDGFYISLGNYTSGSDVVDGYNGYQPNQSYFSAGTTLNNGRYAFCDSFNVTNNIGIFDFKVTTVQTNQYNWQVYQVVNSAADTPLMNTNTWFTITRWQ